jgi:hypothetical protein
LKAELKILPFFIANKNMNSNGTIAVKIYKYVDVVNAKES